MHSADTPDQADCLIRLSKVPALVERLTGERPHVATIHRWAQRGCRSVKLRTAFAGGHRRTSERWLAEFFHEINMRAANEVSTNPQQHVNAGYERAKQDLEAEGF